MMIITANGKLAYSFIVVSQGRCMWYLSVLKGEVCSGTQKGILPFDAPLPIRQCLREACRTHEALEVMSWSHAVGQKSVGMGREPHRAAAGPGFKSSALAVPLWQPPMNFSKNLFGKCLYFQMNDLLG